MKKIILIIVFTINVIQNYAQSPIVDLKARTGKRLDNAYYKDVNNILNQFVGTWVYTNGTTSLKIVLVKKTTIFTGSYYEDLLIGEYQYIVNGVQKFNSLANLSTDLPNIFHHKIYGNHIPRTDTPFDEYFPGENRVKLTFEDNIGGSIVVRRTFVGIQPGIQILRRCLDNIKLESEPILSAVGPVGEFTLIKQ